MEYFLTLAGFVILITSGNFLVKGGVSLARHFGLSTLVIGVTVVAFGTSAPELLVSIQSVLSGSPEMALGNVVGSNISNITLVLAITAIIFPIGVNRVSVVTDWPVMMGAGILLALFAFNGVIRFYEGIIMNIILIGFVWLTLRKSNRDSSSMPNGNAGASYSILVSVAIIVGSSVGLALGAKLLVENASSIARTLGISERAVAISMLAVGTSLPELVTSIIAAIHKETDISVGNIIGSNIFNILSVLGITALIKPLRVNPLVMVDIYLMLVFSFLLFLMMIPAKKGKISRIEGIILILTYIAYMVYVFH